MHVHHHRLARRHRARYAALATSLAVTLALASCSSDDSTSSSTAAVTAASAATAPTATGAPATDAEPAATEAPAATAAPATGGTVLTISDFTFSPTTAQAGVPFTLENDDGFAHTVTAKDGTFDVRVNSGSSETLTIAAPGTYEIFCKIHTSMSGTIVVE